VNRILKLIDTHVHWNVDAFRGDWAQALARAQTAGVQKFVVPAVSQSTHAGVMRMAQAFPHVCFPCTGLHPIDVNADWRSELDFVGQQLARPNSFVALGETGIDCYWSKEFIEEQKTVFEQQLRWSVQYDLPLVIHARDSFDIIFEVLERVKTLPLRGVFHAYSGSLEIFDRICRYGDFKIGVGGVVTFKKAQLAEVVQKLDLSHIILETDAPWLTPEPYRGKRNESSYLPLIAQKIAELKNCTLEEVAARTTENAEKLFKI